MSVHVADSSRTDRLGGSALPVDSWIRRSVLSIGAVDLVMLAGTGVFLAIVKPLDYDWGAAPRAKWVLVQLDLSREQIVAAWWASALLLVAAVLAGLCFLTGPSWRSGGRGARLRQLFWLSAAALLSFLSLDELGSIHERLMATDAGGAAQGSVGPWLVPFGPMLLLAALGVVRLTGRRVSSELLLGSTGVLCISTLGAQERIEGLATEGGGAPIPLTLVEEGTELLGSLLIIVALVLVLRERAASESLWCRLSRRMSRPALLAAAAAAGALLVVGAALSGVAFDPHGDSQRGVPALWFAGVAAAAVATLGAVRILGGQTGVRRLGGLLMAGVGAAMWVVYGGHLIGWLGAAAAVTEVVLAGWLVVAGAVVAAGESHRGSAAAVVALSSAVALSLLVSAARTNTVEVALWVGLALALLFGALDQPGRYPRVRQGETASGVVSPGT